MGHSYQLAKVYAVMAESERKDSDSDEQWTHRKTVPARFRAAGPRWLAVSSIRAIHVHPPSGVQCPRITAVAVKWCPSFVVLVHENSLVSMKTVAGAQDARATDSESNTELITQ